MSTDKYHKAHESSIVQVVNR